MNQDMSSSLSAGQFLGAPNAMGPASGSPLAGPGQGPLGQSGAVGGIGNSSTGLSGNFAGGMGSGYGN